MYTHDIDAHLAQLRRKYRRRALAKAWLSWSAATVLLFLMIWLFLTGLANAASPIDHDVLYSRLPRSLTGVSPMPDVTDPLGYPPGTHLVKWDHLTGQESIWKDAGPDGAIFDIDATGLNGPWVGYTWCKNVRARNPQRFNLPLEGCSLWKKHKQTGEEVLLVDHTTTWFPLETYANWSKRPDKADPAGTAYPGYGVFNSGLAFLPSPDGSDCFSFTSNMDNLDALKWDSATAVTFRVWRVCHGRMEQTWFAPTGVLHPVLRPDGRLMFSTLENALLRDGRSWGLWEMNPDGSGWAPSMSATKDPFNVPHFHTSTPNNYVISTLYYPFNNNGLGTLLTWPITTTGQTNLQAPYFVSFVRAKNPKIPMGNFVWQYDYTPVGLENLTRWTFQDDRDSPKDSTGAFVGKVSHPWWTRGGLLVAYSPGPAHEGSNPPANAGIYFIPDGLSTDSPKNLIPVVKETPEYNRIGARPALTFAEIYGSEPRVIPDIANDGSISPWLPVGTPYTQFEVPTVCFRESMSGQSMPGWKGQRPMFYLGDEVNTATNMDSQGADGRPDIACTDIVALRFVALGGVPHIGYGDPAAGLHTNTFIAGNQEARQVLGMVPLHKTDPANPSQPLMDPSGFWPDTSAIVLLPCDTSVAFEALDSKGRTLVHTPTWRQGRCGEKVNGCTGCHTHTTIVPYKIEQTVAGKPGYMPAVLVNQPTYTSEWRKHVEPLVRKHCVSCHNATAPAGSVDLDTATPIQGNIPRNAAVLMRNRTATLGGSPPPIGTDYVHQASRWTHPYFAIKGMLSWLLWGERLDGFSNSSFPSLPAPGLQPWQLDLDFTDAVRDAHQHLLTTMTDSERLVIDHWIDEGMPVDTDPSGKRGWRTDVHRPVISWGGAGNQTPPAPLIAAAPLVPGTCQCIAPGVCQCECSSMCPPIPPQPDPGNRLYFGLADVGSGVNQATLKVTRDGQPVITTQESGSRWSAPREAGLWKIEVQDMAGNWGRRTEVVK